MILSGIDGFKKMLPHHLFHLSNMGTLQFRSYLFQKSGDINLLRAFFQAFFTLSALRSVARLSGQSAARSHDIHEWSLGSCVVHMHIVIDFKTTGN